MVLISRPISVVGCAWDSPSSGQNIVSEIQINNEKEVVSDIHGNVGLDDMPENSNQEIT